MPVPKKKHSHSRQNSRRSQHDKVDPPTLTKCANCEAFKKPHKVCGSCGFYRGRKVIEVPELKA